MRLKCIKLAGFKSFVDPTTVNFPSNLCAVVGPNGCGKSNIIDAVRWVMGESSAKNLRGENMTDVIFNGSGGRKPVGQASIELVFDNSDHRIKGEYAQYNEISIKRKVTRDGQSSYMLNGTKCRRRDITDIFLGTGLGARSYSIIEQGMVSRLIESKPEELRVFIEEAAGISKYKERRRDTENRIKRTRENLERLTDLREEMGRQLQHLHRQAQAAEKYGELKQQERTMTAQHNALRWKALNDELEAKQAVIGELEIKIEAAVADQRAADADIEKHIADNAEFNEQLAEVQSRYYELGNAIARIEQSIEHQIERIAQIKRDLAETEEGWGLTQKELEADHEKVKNLESELEIIEPKLEEALAIEEESSIALEEAEERMQQWQSEWDEFSQRAEEPRQIAEVEQSRIQQLERIVERGLERKKRLEEEKAALGDNPEQEIIDELSIQVSQLEEQLEQHQSANSELADEIETERSRGQTIANDLDRARSELQSLKGKSASLEALQKAALGRNNEGLNRWLQSNKLDQNKRLAESIRVSEGYEAAVEAVLADYLQSICVEGIDDVDSLLSELPDGLLSLVDTGVTTASSTETGGKTPLADKINSSWDSAALTAGIYVAEDLSAALALRSELKAGESVVTKQGVWLGKAWIRVRKAADEKAGLLERKGEISRLEEQIAMQTSRVEELVDEQAAGREALRDLETKREEVQREIAQTARQYSELKSQLGGRLMKVEQTNLRRERLQHELDELLKQLSVEEENTAQARSKLQVALDTMEEDTDRKEQLLHQRDERREVLDQARQKARHDKDQAHQLALQQQSLTSQLKSVRDTLDRMASQVQRAKERIESLTKQLSDTDSPIDLKKAELEEQLQKRLEVEEQLNAAKAKADGNEHQLRELEHQRSHHERTAAALRENLMEHRLKSEGDNVKRAALQEQLVESKFDLQTVLANIPEDLDQAGCERELESIANRIQRLGAINLAAIDEYKQQSERKVYLDAQNEDLERALVTLENAIRKIDKETRTRFKETFDKINAGLQELFPKVFGGGHAYLDMTGEDLLDTGVAIMARPPGKRNSTIHLLSGGEKAMTAIALVFSIFRLNPSPFCMLDEVDAPLDDANVGRYARLVAEMSDAVQFVFITHNKLTMEMANQLLGVTMHEPGVSRIVAVDIEEAAELAAM
ncbi:MAG: chromosome segregation protein SMC [Pseudohongiellaceae bacterium]|nr:chromosome segregation protein SMC [Pseudohongiellaceae bacterium]